MRNEPKEKKNLEQSRKKISAQPQDGKKFMLKKLPNSPAPPPKKMKNKMVHPLREYMGCFPHPQNSSYDKSAPMSSEIRNLLNEKKKVSNERWLH